MEVSHIFSTVRTTLVHTHGLTPKQTEWLSALAAPGGVLHDKCVIPSVVRADHSQNQRAVSLCNALALIRQHASDGTHVDLVVSEFERAFHPPSSAFFE